MIIVYVVTTSDADELVGWRLFVSQCTKRGGVSERPHSNLIGAQYQSVIDRRVLFT
ncbi:hypothetical protein E2C01_058680 [Portunus trituberculatus]|uniref:Uncharacterized protein n=1 Tax=Portunus trituberculatus TaxID=210409 RepID=A0A5B7H0H2_PORTR|nr:hypothetical protein [Portunus trituberculatus]